MNSGKSFTIVTQWQKCSYSSLLEKSKQTILHLKYIKRIACEVYKSLNILNPAFMTNIFEERNISYDLRAVLWLSLFKKKKIID